MQYAEFCIGEGRPGDAISALERVLERDAGLAAAWFELGFLQRESSVLDAIRSFRTFLDLVAENDRHGYSSRKPWVYDWLMVNDDQVPDLAPDGNVQIEYDMDFSYEVQDRIVQRFFFHRGGALQFNLDGDPIQFTQLEFEIETDHRHIKRLQISVENESLETALEVLAYLGTTVDEERLADGHLAHLQLEMDRGAVDRYINAALDAGAPLDLKDLMEMLDEEDGSILLDFFYYRVRSFEIINLLG